MFISVIKTSTEQSLLVNTN